MARKIVQEGEKCPQRNIINFSMRSFCLEMVGCVQNVAEAVGLKAVATPRVRTASGSDRILRALG